MVPIHEIDKDPVRKELDEKFCRDVLGSAPIRSCTGWGTGCAADEVGS